MVPLKHAVLLRLALGVFVAITSGAARADSVALAHPQADTGLFEYAPTNNLGAMTFVPAGTTSVGTRCRALFRFDPATFLPANATVHSVTLWLSVPQSAGWTSGFGLHRVLVSWGEGRGIGGPAPPGVLGSPAGEGEASWEARFTSTNDPVLWSIPGGKPGVDFLATASALGSLGTPGTTNAFTSPALAADLQLWLNHPDTNFGWVLVATNEAVSGSAVRVGTREDPENAPLLVVDYTAPGSSLRISGFAIVGRRFDFTFDTESNLSYTIEYRDSLNSGSWSVLTNIPAEPSAGSMTISDDLGGSNRFYRVRIP